MSFTINDLKKLRESEEYKKKSKVFSKLLFLGEKIYTRRKDLGLTQAELGKLSHITQNKISELEHGTYGEPKTEVLTRLSEALQIPLEYLSSENISRKTVETYNFIFSKLERNPDIMQFMKLPYFIDLAALKNIGTQLSNFSYIRWHYGPFDKKVYSYQSLFSNNIKAEIPKLTYLYLSADEQDIISQVMEDLPIDDSEKLKALSYETEPMKKLGVEIGDLKCMGEELEMV